MKCQQRGRTAHVSRVVTAAIALALAVNSAAQAQTKLDEKAVRELPQAFATAFNKHDGHQLAQIMADDIDFVTVGAMWLHGKPDFEKYHTRLLNGRFSSVKFEVLKVAVRFLRPDIAIVHWGWTIAGDKNVDGTARERRYGMMTMVAEKRNGSWLVVASQNDNADPWDPADGQMPNLAMPIPGPDQDRQ
jgi:uncharacterized protein (TIGR02246 family)